jgi:hypothetical protein
MWLSESLGIVGMMTRGEGQKEAVKGTSLPDVTHEKQ